MHLMKRLFLAVLACPIFAAGVVYEATALGEHGQVLARVIAIADRDAKSLNLKVHGGTIAPIETQLQRVGQGPGGILAYVSAKRGGDASMQATVVMNDRLYLDLATEKLSVMVRGKSGIAHRAVLKRSDGTVYEVTITNITRGQVISPPVAVTYAPDYEVFTLGQPAPTSVRALAEEGDASGVVADVFSADLGFYGAIAQGPLAPGESTTVDVVVRGRQNRIAVLGMLVQTNDGFFAATDLKVDAYPYPVASSMTQKHLAFAYDAGSEANNEECVFIPGCGGSGERAEEGAEGFVSSHAGIHGIADLDTSTYDWRGPVVQVTLNRVRRDPITLIQNTTVIEGATTTPQTGMDLLIEGDEILQIANSRINPPTGAKVIDGSGKYVIPGFIDMHTHYWETGAPNTSPVFVNLDEYIPFDQHRDWVDSRAFYTYSRFLCGGVTTMMEQSGPYFAFTLREQASKMPFSPRIRLAGRFIGNDDFGFHFWREEDPAVVATYDPEVGRQWVIEAAELGANHIKVGYVQGDRPIEDWTPVFDAMLEEAHARGLKVVIHVTTREPAKEFMRRGVDVLAHPLWEDQPDQEYIDLMVSSGVSLTTSLYIWRAEANVWSGDPNVNEIESLCGDPQVIDSWNWINEIPNVPTPGPLPFVEDWTRNTLDSLAWAYQAGVPIIVGSDAGNIGLLAGASMHREFEMMAEAGMTSPDIVKASAWNAAVAMGISDNVGAVRQGYKADLLILDADPTADWRNLSQIDTIITKGTVIPHATLQQMSDDTEPLDPIIMKRKLQHSHGAHASRKPYCH